MMLMRAEDREILLTEYKAMYERLHHSTVLTLTIDSILVPSSIVCTALAIEFQGSLNALYPFGIKTAGFLPIFSVIMLLAATFYTYSTGQIHNHIWRRLFEIEEAIGMKGHRDIHYRVKDTLWVQLWSILWRAILLVAIIIYSITSILLFI